MYVHLNRIQEEPNGPTLGALSIYDGERKVFGCVAIELPWRNNAQRKSRIPAGRYPLVLEYSPRFRRMLWEIKNVPNRTECKFHVANYMRQLHGCVALGKRFADIDRDGKLDVAHSSLTLEDFHSTLREYEQVELIIEDPHNHE